MSTLTVTHTESLSLNGADRGSVKTLIIDGIASVYETVFTVSTVNMNILKFANNPAGSSNFKLDTDKTKYIRFSNLDDTSKIYLAFSKERDDVINAEIFQITILPGESFVISSPENYMDVTTESDTPAYVFGSLAEVNAKSDSGTPSLEIFAAGI